MTVSEARLPRRRVFLSHNRLDRERIRDIAEALELEYGVPHFLDENAISAGDEFMRVIRDALETSTACAIFLGASGWGPTHLVETEMALARYRRDPEFRLIPILLPGARAEDMARLGQGTLFRDLNRIDAAADDAATVVRKLAEAVAGQRPDGERGPARLTPYLIRRDAGRWLASGRKDRSLLYRGAELVEAERIAANSPDVVAAEQVLPFLTAAAQAQRMRFRATIAIAAAVVIVIGGIAAYAWRQQTLAESRQAAAEAQITPFRDRGLLLALEAERIAPTSEARGAQMALLGAMPHIDRFLHGHTAGVRAVTFSDDGKQVAAGAEDGRILIWEWRANAEPRVLQAGGASVRSLVFAHGGTLIAGDAAGTLHVIDLTGRVVALKIAKQPIAALAVSGTLLAAADESGRVTLVDLVLQRSTSAVDSGIADLRSVDFDPGAQRIAIGGENGRFALIEVATSRMAEPPPRSRSDITTMHLVRFVDEGRLLVTLNASGFLETWRTPGLAIVPDRRYELHAGVVAADLRGRLESINDVVISDAVGAISGFRITDAAPWAHGTLRAHRLLAPALRFSRDGDWLVSGGVGSEVIVWNLRRVHPLIVSTKTIESIPDAIAWNWAEIIIAPFAGEGERVTISSDGTRFATARADGHVIITGVRPATLFIPNVVSLRFDDEGRRLAVGTRSGEIVVIGETNSRQLLRKRGAAIASLRFSHDATRLAAGDQSGLLEVWSLDSSEAVARVRAHRGPLFAVAFDPCDRFIASGGGGADRGVRFWRARDLASLGEVGEQHARAVSAIEFAPDGRTMISADDGGTIVLWDPADRRIAGRIAFVEDTMITSLAVRADGEAFAVNADRDIHTFALAPTERQRVLRTIANRAGSTR